MTLRHLLSLGSRALRARHCRIQAAAAIAAGALVTIPATHASAQITLSFSANPPTLRVNAASTAGQPPTTVTSGLTSWSLLGVWAISPRITANLTQAMPPGVTLEVQMSAPLTGGTSTGWIVLSTTAQNVVTNLPLVAISGIAITYRLSATSAAGIVALTSRTVTYTVVWS